MLVVRCASRRWSDRRMTTTLAGARALSGAVGSQEVVGRWGEREDGM